MMIITIYIHTYIHTSNIHTLIHTHTYIPHGLAELPFVHTTIGPSIHSEPITLIMDKIALVCVTFVPIILPYHTYIQNYIRTLYFSTFN